MDLIVEGRGSFVAKHQGRLRVMRESKVAQEAPLIHLEHVLIVDKGVSLSSDAIQACTDEGIPIYFMSGTGHVYASLYSAGLTGTVLTRRAQLAAYDSGTGVSLARAYIRGKLENQINLLRYIGKYRKENDPAAYEEIVLVAAEMRDHLAELERLPRAESIDEERELLLSIEGRAAQRYWAMVGRLIPATLEWPGRETRGARDAFNSALNYGYGVLYGQVERALLLAGLDPFGGFLHADRPGKNSLVLDAIEEFRQAIVDRTIIGLVNRGTTLDQDDGQLTQPVRRKIAEKVLERIESTEPYEGKRQPLRVILQSQARHAATFLRGERSEYVPFVASW